MRTNDEMTTYAMLAADQEFQSLESNRERIEFVLNFVKPLQEYRAEIFERANGYCYKHRKNLRKSRAFRTEGRYFFKAKDYQSSIYSFTKVSINSRINTVFDRNFSSISNFHFLIYRQ
jgi:hypothetical protein